MLWQFPNENIEFVIQNEQLGIAHALKQAEPLLIKVHKFHLF